MPNTSDQHRANTKDFATARSEPRIATAMVVEVSGFDAAGCFFTKRTSTANVSKNGCWLRLNAGVGPNALIAIQLGAGGNLSSRPCSIRCVAGNAQSRGRGRGRAHAWRKRVARFYLGVKRHLCA